MRKYLKWLSWRRVYCKIVKQEGCPKSVARGMALGLVVGFFMPIGFQLVVAIPFAFLLRANKALAIVGTMVTNPYTAPFIYPAQCWLGAFAMGKPLRFSVLNSQMKGLIANPDWADLLQLGEDLLIPFFVGGAILAVATAIPGYYASLAAVRAYRRRKEKKRLLRMKRFEDARKSLGDVE